jgi:hypothetical protein
MRSRRIKMAPIALAVIMMATGCAVGKVEGQVDDAGGGQETDMSTSVEPDMGQMADSGVDMAPPPSPPPAELVAPSAGGGVLETPQYRMRLIVGPQGGAGAAETPQYRMRIGAGAAQHDQ